MKWILRSMLPHGGFGVLSLSTTWRGFRGARNLSGIRCALCPPPRPGGIRFTVSLGFDVAGVRGRGCTVLNSCAASRWSVRRGGFFYKCNCCSRLSALFAFEADYWTSSMVLVARAVDWCIICHALTDSASSARTIGREGATQKEKRDEREERDARVLT